MTTIEDPVFEDAARKVCGVLLNGNLNWEDEVLDNLAIGVINDRAENGSEWLSWSTTKATLLVRAAELVLEACVADDRAIGLSWRDIGTSMGKSASTVHRWAALRNIDERATEISESGVIADRVRRALGELA